MRRGTRAVRSAGGIGGCGHGRRSLLLDVGPRGAGRRSWVSFDDSDDVFRLPFRALAAASDPDPEQEPDLEGEEARRSRRSTRSPETSRDAFLLPSMSPVAPAPHRHAGSATVSTGAGRAVDKLRTFVGCSDPPYHGATHMLLFPGNCVERVEKSSVFGHPAPVASVGNKRWIWMQQRRCSSTYSDTDPRSHSELPSPPQHSINFMHPYEEGSTRTAPFNIWTEGKNTFSAAIAKDKANCEKNQLCNDNIIKVFAYLEPALRVRGLLSPFSLRDRRSRGLHSYYKGIVEDVTYITAYDLAKNYLFLPGRSRRPFLDFLCEEHVIVSPDSESTGTFVRHTLYDHGLRFPPNYRTLHKGESDASFDIENKKAVIAAMIWKDDQVVWCEVLQDIPCTTSVEAEALAMCLLLRRAIELNILHLEACTDCQDVANVVQGDKVYVSDEKKESLYKLFDLLRSMVGYFEDLVCRCCPRENLLFVDGLMRDSDILKDSFTAKQDPSGRSDTEKKLSMSMINKWRHILKGELIFNFKEKGSSQLKNTAMKTLQHPGDGLKTHSLCYHVVEGDCLEDKVYASWHIVRELKPVEVHVRVKDVSSCLGVLKNVFGLRRIEDVSKGDNSDTLCLQFNDQVGDDEGSKVAEGKDLVKELKTRRLKLLNIVLDVEVLETVRLDEDCLTVVLANTEEKNKLKELEEFSPVTIASFHSK